MRAVSWHEGPRAQDYIRSLEQSRESLRRSRDSFRSQLHEAQARIESLEERGNVDADVIELLVQFLESKKENVLVG